MDNELLLIDRIDIIKKVNDKYDLEHNAYISFSGGKDSTLLSYLIDLALPNNNIPRVYFDTGIEYQAIKEFVQEKAKDDNRFVIIKSSKSVRQVLETYGYPYKSKEHSHILSIYQHSGETKSVLKYLSKIEGNRIKICPKCLEYQFTPEYNLKVSDRCCYKLKKEPARKYEKQSGKSIAILGLRTAEGGQRSSHKGCVIYDKDKNIKKFSPLNPVNDEWEDWVISKYNIQLCKLYYPPYNFKRTGCKGCPYSLNLDDDLDTMERLLPLERKQCEIIWGKVYEEYRKHNYRLKREKQLKLF